MPSFKLDDYVPVNERLELFRKDHPNWGLVSDLIHNDGETVIVRALITDETGREIASGLAEEKRGSTNVNRTSAVENCETSAWGRALANLAYEVKRGIASREEMAKAADADADEDEDGDGMQRSSVSTTAPPDPIKARQAKAIGVIEKLSKAQRSAMRQLMMTNNISTKPDAWNTEEILDKVAALVLEARKAPADPEPVEATA